jgi:hypothetical protein
MKRAAAEEMKSLAFIAEVLSGDKETIFTLRVYHAIEKDITRIHFREGLP